MRVDPITVEIIRCALKAAANEMSVVLKRTAYNMMIYEVQDYCVSIVDHEGLTMSQNEGALPKKRREREFSKLKDDEVALIERIVRDAFEGFEGVVAAAEGASPA